MLKATAILLAALCAGCAATAQRPANRDDGCITLVAAGDVLLDRGVRRRAFVADDPAWPLAGVPDILRGADIALANLECPLTVRRTPVAKAFAFRCDPGGARLLRRAGFDALCLANNHVYDQGRAAILDTIGHLERAGVAAVGAGPNHEDACRPRVIEAGGLRVALAAFVTLPLEGIAWAPGKPMPAVADEPCVARALRAARELADFVVVTVHWGREFEDGPDAGQLLWAEIFRRHGADLILGHHPHVIQPVDELGGKWTFYSLGNFVFDQDTPPRDLALAARVTLCPGGVRGVSLVPVEIEDCRPRRAGPGARRRILQRLGRISEGVRFTPEGDGGIRVEMVDFSIHPGTCFNCNFLEY